MDTEPPTIVSVSPAPLSLFFHDSRIVLEFDEHVDHQSVEGAIFVSPSLGPLEFDWSGTEVEITFKDTLRSNTTYVFNVGTDVVDIRNKNRMANAFSLAFSTGGTIDPGTITGRVYPASISDQLSGITVFAYKLDGINPDTLNPSKQSPDYVTQTGKTGEFLLAHLALGTYRLLAVRDEYKNLLYDRETDEYACSPRSVHLTSGDTLETDVVMKLAREDTTGARLVKVTPVDRSLLVGEFSEPIDTSFFTSGAFQVGDTTGGHLLEIRSVAARLPQLKEFYVATEEESAGQTYELRIRGVRDLSGNDVSASAASIQFVSSYVSDTTLPAVASFSLTDSSLGVEVRPLIEIRFSEPVKRVEWKQMVELGDSLDKPVPVEGDWANDAAIAFRPSRDLAGSAWHKLTVHTGMLRDLRGLAGKDTLRILRFQTLDPERLSSMSGLVSDANNVDTTGPLIVTAWPVGKKAGEPRSVTLERPGTFQILQLPEGRYLMQVFRDRNRNRKYDAGTAFPYTMAERFSVAPDTLKLRARWPLENVNIQLK